MAKLEISGKIVEVDDSFLKLAPAEQQKIVEGISASLAPKETAASPASPVAKPTRGDQVRADYEKMPGWQKPLQALDDMARVGASGATFGFADKIAAGGSALANMAGIGGKPYDEAIREQRQATEDARSRAGWAGTAGEVLGGVATGGAAANAGLTAARFIPQGLSGAGRLGARIGAGAADGAAMGLAAGAGNTDDGNYLPNMAKSGLIGMGIGGAVPAVVGALSSATRPVRDALAAQFSPEGYARRIATNAMDRSGQSIDDIRAKITAALSDAQPQYTVADAMGNAGARSLNGVARGNSPVASRIVETLDARQSGQGGRIAGNFDEAFGTGSNTASDVRRTITDMRSQEANANYGSLRSQTGSNGFWSPELEALTSRPSVRQAIEAVAETAAERGHSVTNPFVKGPNGTMTLPPGVKPGFDFWDNVKRGIDKQINADPRNADLVATKKALLKIMDDQVPGYAAARAPFREASEALDAVDTGRAAATRGRSEDTIREFSGLKPAQQIGHRVGYADRNIETIQSAADGVNKARPFINDASRAEIPALAEAGRGDKLVRQLGRENEMFQTRATATGGSQTANNLADLAAIGGGGLYDYFGGGGGSGLGLGAALAAARRGISTARANPSEAGREELVRALLGNNPDVIGSMIAKQIKSRDLSEKSVSAIARALIGGSIAADR